MILDKDLIRRLSNILLRRLGSLIHRGILLENDGFLRRIQNIRQWSVGVLFRVHWHKTIQAFPSIGDHGRDFAEVGGVSPGGFIEAPA